MTQTPPSEMTEPTSEASELAETVVPTIVGQVILDDDFDDNRNRWLEQDEQLISSGIWGARYNHILHCPTGYDSFFCGNYFIVPTMEVRDFRLEFDAKITDISPDDSIVMLAIQFRDINGSYYLVSFSSTGVCSMKLVDRGKVYDLLQNESLSEFNGIGLSNRFAISAQDKWFTLSVNGADVKPIEDGKINQKGSLYLVLYVSRGGSAEIELDNFLIVALP